MLKKYFVFLILLLLILSFLLPQKKEFKVEVKTHDGKIIPLYRECHALVIGISDYMTGWPPFPDAVKNSEEIGNVLERIGFIVVRIKNPTKSQFIKSLEDFICGPGLNPDNCMVLYFAGHGYTEKLSYGGEMGFIIPKDAPLPDQNKAGFRQRAIDLPTIEAFARKIEAKHALFIFDCCVSGTTFNTMRIAPSQTGLKIEKPVRQFILAGRPEESSQESSLFTTQLIKALEGEADQDSDGYVIGTELGKFLYEKVTNFSKETQHPQLGLIRDPNLDKGDFVFAFPEIKPVEQKVEVVSPKIEKLIPESPGPEKMKEKELTPKTQTVQDKSTTMKSPETVTSDKQTIASKSTVLTQIPPVLDTTPQFVLQFGSLGIKKNQINDPRGISIDTSGHLYIVDSSNYRILKFTSNGDFTTAFGSQGSGDGELMNPYGVAVDTSGFIYVIEKENHRVQKFASDGSFVDKWGVNGSGREEFMFPEGITVDEKGRIYVTDSGNHRIQIYDSKRKLIEVWGSLGTGPGEFKWPKGIAIDNSGFVYMLDSGNDRIQKFTLNGFFLKEWGSRGKEKGMFDFPEGIAVDNKGHVFVADTWNHRIQIFDNEGNFIQTFGYKGNGEGRFVEPTSLAVDDSGYLYIADTRNRRIQKFDLKPLLSKSTLAVTSQKTTLPTEGTEKQTDEAKKDQEQIPLKNNVREKVEYLGPIKMDESTGLKIANKVEPVYPEIARQARIEGIVRVEAITDENGKVVRANVVSSPNIVLNQAAIDAVMQWEVGPVIINGRPRSVIFIAKVIFELHK